jgi:hypothetical protein
LLSCFTLFDKMRKPKTKRPTNGMATNNSIRIDNNHSGIIVSKNI